MTGISAKIYGERNSGTNFVEQMLRLNLPIGIVPNIPDVAEAIRARAASHRMPWTCRRSYVEGAWDRIAAMHDEPCLGWKHRLLDRAALDRYRRLAACETVFVAVIRNPVSWARSMHRHPFHALAPVDPDFATFLERPWLCVGREHLDDPLLASPLALWRLKVGAYAELAAAGTLLMIRYEDALLDPAATLSRIARAANCPPPDTPRLPVGNARHFSNDARGYDDYRRSFTRESVGASVAPAVLRRIVEGAGPDLVGALYPDLFGGDGAAAAQTPPVEGPQTDAAVP